MPVRTAARPVGRPLRRPKRMRGARPLTVPEAHGIMSTKRGAERRMFLLDTFLDERARSALQRLGYNHALGPRSLRPMGPAALGDMAEVRRGVGEARNRVIAFAMNPRVMYQHPQKSSEVRDAAFEYLKELEGGLAAMGRRKKGAA